MKNIILTLTLFLCFISSAQKQNIKVTYIKGLKPISDTTEKKPSLLKDIYYTLLSNGIESIFYYKKGLELTGKEENKRFIGMGGGSGVYYKDISKKEYLHQDHFLGKQYLIRLEEKDWTLTKEEKKVNNFLCKKAISTKVFFSEILQKKIKVEYIAWYTLEIPIPFGPTVFNGLPGLVLAGQVGGSYYYANKIEFNLKLDNIKKPHKGIKISEIDLNNKINQFEKKEYQKYFKKQ